MSNYSKKLAGKTTINAKAPISPVEPQDASLDLLSKLFDERAQQPIQAQISLPAGEHKVTFIKADKIIDSVHGKVYAAIYLEKDGAKVYPVRYIIPQAIDIFFNDLSRIMLQFNINVAANMAEINKHSGEEITVWSTLSDDGKYTNIRFYAPKTTEESTL